MVTIKCRICNDGETTATDRYKMGGEVVPVCASCKERAYYVGGMLNRNTEAERHRLRNWILEKKSWCSDSFSEKVKNP
jgi:hypothetical protein